MLVIKKIDVKKLILFYKYNEDIDLLLDNRTNSKKDLKLISIKEFEILDRLAESITISKNIEYSQNLQNISKREINRLKQFVTDNVLNIMSNDELVINYKK